LKVKAYKIAPRTLRTLVDWGLAGVDSMVGRAHCSAEDRALIRGFARDLGLLPPENFYKSIQFAGRPVTQIELTGKLASALSPDEIRRRELASGSKTKTQAIP
jgi:hypothetical protein